MARILKLTESDLIRLVKRVIKEQEHSWPDYKTCISKVPTQLKGIIQGLYTSTNEFNTSILSNWDERGIVNSILQIKSKQQYDQINKLFECFVEINAHEPGLWSGKDFIKFIIDESLMDFMDIGNLKKVTEHLVSAKIIDRNSQYCKDKKYTGIGNEGMPGIGFFCSGQEM